MPMDLLPAMSDSGSSKTTDSVSILDSKDRPVWDWTPAELDQAAEEDPKFDEHLLQQYENMERTLLLVDRQKEDDLTLLVTTLQAQSPTRAVAVQSMHEWIVDLQRAVFSDYSLRLRFLMGNVKFVLAKPTPYWEERPPGDPERARELQQLLARVSDPATFWELMADALPADLEQYLPEAQRTKKAEAREERQQEQPRVEPDRVSDHLCNASACPMVAQGSHESFHDP